MNEDTNGDMPSTWFDAYQRQRDEQVFAERAAREERALGNMRENASFFNGLMDMHGRTVAELEKRNRRGAAAMLSAFKLAKMNGGDMPDDFVIPIGEAMGYDGRTRAIGHVSVDDNDEMTIRTARANPQGGDPIWDAPIKIPAKTIYGLGRENLGILSRDEMENIRWGQRKPGVTQEMVDKDFPALPDNYGQVRTPVGERTPTGGVSVPGSWLYGPQRRANISAFGANGRGGFTNYDSNEQTGYQLVQRDSGTRAEGDKGRWKVLSRGADPNGDDGTQITRYENDKTGEVVSVRDGETPPWESRAVGEKERIARINADGKIKAAEKANETKMSLAEAANALKQYGIDVSAQLKERGLDIQQQNANERSAHNRATEGQMAENEKGRNGRAKMANETKTKMAEMKSRGTIGGRPPTTHEYVEALRFANDLLNDEADRNAMREHAKRIEESLKQRGEKIPEPPSPSGKAEVKTGDNGAREIRKDRNSVEWEIIRDVNGKPVGKRRIN